MRVFLRQITRDTAFFKKFSVTEDKQELGSKGKLAGRFAVGINKLLNVHLISVSLGLTNSMYNLHKSFSITELILQRASLTVFSGNGGERNPFYFAEKLHCIQVGHAGNKVQHRLDFRVFIGF